MRLTDRYIAKQILIGTLIAILILSLVLVMGNLFKQVRPLLVDMKAPPMLVLRFILNVVPFSLMFTIPWGFLSAVLVVFGRMSSDQEITALRVAGVSLTRIAMPVFVIGALLSALCMFINVNVVPLAKASMTEMLYEQIKKDPRSLLNPGLVQSNFKNQRVFVESREGDSLHGFHVYQVSNGDAGSAARAEAYVHADKVSLLVDEEKKQLRLKLEDACFVKIEDDGSSTYAFAKEAEPWVFDFGNDQHRKMRSSSMTNGEITRYISANPDLPKEKKVELRAEITKRYSFSLACLAFTCVAVPLGLKSKRKDNSSGLVLSLGIGMIYFLITAVAEGFETDLAATLALWSPNVLCALLGFQLFKRARFQ
jgi:lipopolysaccharide export LptBFGC system permease protein LptF